MRETVSIEVPREIIHATRMTPQDLKRELAIFLFQQGKLSFGKAREMTGMTVWVFQQLLASRKISIHYDIEDYDEDRVTLRRDALSSMWDEDHEALWARPRDHVEAFTDSGEENVYSVTPAEISMYGL